MPPLSFSAWMDPADPAALASFEANAGRLARVYPDWYRVSATGTPFRRREAGAAHRARVLDVARVCPVRIWPMVGNRDAGQGGFDPALMRLIMGDMATRRAHIAALRRLVEEDSAQGLDLGYAGLYSSDRDAYSGFVEELCAAFRKTGLGVGVCVSAEPGDADGPGSGRALDAARLAKACDRLHLLGFHGGVEGAFGGTGDAPGPLVPSPRLGAALDRALALVPAQKLELGLPGAGCAWGPGGPPAPVPWSVWEGMVREHPPARRDPGSAELTLRPAQGEVWMGDAISLTAKLWQARLRGVAQAALLGLGGEDPRVWALLDTLPGDFLGTDRA